MNNRRKIFVGVGILTGCSFLTLLCLLAARIHVTVKAAKSEFGRAEEYLAKGNAYYDQGHYLLAATAYSNALRAVPNWETARDNLDSALRMAASHPAVTNGPSPGKQGRALRQGPQIKGATRRTLMRGISAFYATNGRWPESEQEVRESCTSVREADAMSAVSEIRLSRQSDGLLEVTYTLASDAGVGVHTQSLLLSAKEE